MENESLSPDEGELVLATVKRITPHGVHVTLDEYGDLDGFLHISEISTGWVRQIERYLGVGQKKILKVNRISKSRKEIDLSLRLVSNDERRKKLISIKKSEKANKILSLVEKKLNLDYEVSKKYRNLLLEEYGDLYDILEQVAKEGQKIFKESIVPNEYLSTLEEVAKEKVAITNVKVHGILELTSNKPNGIDTIKSILSKVENTDIDGAKIKIKYMGAPKYRINVEAENYKIAEKILKIGVQKIKKNIEKKEGTFNFKR